MQSAIILAGGKSTRMGMNKALVNILGKPLLSWSVDSLSKLVDDLVVVARNDTDAKLYEKILSGRARLVMDDSELEGPLVGIISGFKAAKSNYCYVHPIDSPIIKKEVIEYLFQQAKNFDGAVWKIQDDMIEPLHAVYQVSSVLGISERILRTGNTSAKILSKEITLNYVSIETLRSLDKELISLFNINTLGDVEFIENYLKAKPDV
ncbi:MAG: molybdenum cofactor guanylyltransferase [Thaumarchaeota archaeon]|nr:molybdenum cofactor guanylyltransferase [Nitrososphaerota archaeon]